MKIYIILLLNLIIFNFISCKKNIDLTTEKKTDSQNTENIPAGFFKDMITPGEVDNTISKTSSNNLRDLNSFDLNGGEDSIILGNQLNNPYTVANMQTANDILTAYTGPTIVANKKYVRFKPSTIDQLAVLEDDDNLDLQDHPMDYSYAQDGDFYQNPNEGNEDLPWLYTSVPIVYTPPPGITYEIISELFVPDNNPLLESMAESIAGNATYESEDQPAKISITRTDVIPNLVFEKHKLDEPNYCGDNPNDVGCGGGGYVGTGNGSAEEQPGFFVEDQINCNVSSSVVPIKQLRVVCRRWFKRWQGYTNDLGQFNCTTNFKKKIKLKVKTKNQFARISKVRGVRVWNMILPMRKRFGNIENMSDLSKFRYIFNKNSDAQWT